MSNLFELIARLTILISGFGAMFVLRPTSYFPELDYEMEHAQTTTPGGQTQTVHETDLVFEISGPEILEHPGGEQLEHSTISAVTDEVISNLSSVPKTPEFKHLVFETMVVETLVGKASYGKAAKRNNFGIAQIRPETAKEVLKKIKKKNINDYYYIKSLKNSNFSLKHNLLYNVHFSVAICAEFYALKKIRSLDTKHLRARIWKRYYNTNKGSGTVEAYVKRVNKYYASL